MKNLRYSIIILFSSILLHTPLQAGSLTAIYHEALEHDTQYKIARHAFTATQERLTDRKSVV